MNIFSEEHNLLRQSISIFNKQKVLPYFKSWEASQGFPSNLFEDLAQEGFLGILISEEWGGVGGDYLMAGAWLEEWAKVPAQGLVTAINMHSLVITPALERFGTQTAKEQFLRDAVLGKKIGAYAFTEPGAGSDLTGIRTTAKKDGNNYILNGSKIFITNGARADFVLVLAKTSQDLGYQGFSTFLVDTKTPGFSVSKKLDKLGWHSSDTAELSFEDVVVPSEMVLGEIGRGWHQAMVSLEWERLMLSVSAIVGAETCLAQTLEYIDSRKAFGKRIADFDYSQKIIFACKAKLAAAHALAHHCLMMLNNGQKNRKEVSLLKIFACELAIKVANRCLQLHGGYGYTTEFLPELWLRDLRLYTIGGGTSEVMAKVAAKETFPDYEE